jgi:hypothetical protein
MCANREFRCAEIVPHKMVAFSALPEGSLYIDKFGIREHFHKKHNKQLYL